MKSIAKIIFKLHKMVYHYPARSEVRLSLDADDGIGVDWFVGMLYICGQPIESIAEDLQISRDEVKDILNKLVKDLKI